MTEQVTLIHSSKTRLCFVKRFEDDNGRVYSQIVYELDEEKVLGGLEVAFRFYMKQMIEEASKEISFWHNVRKKEQIILQHFDSHKFAEYLLKLLSQESIKIP